MVYRGKTDAEYLHQYAVDTYGAQHPGGRTRAISIVFGLIGLYLAREKGCYGRQIQRVHMQIAKIRRDRPRLEPPGRPAVMSVRDVLQVLVWSHGSAGGKGFRQDRPVTRAREQEGVGRCTLVIAWFIAAYTVLSRRTYFYDCLLNC